MKRIPLLTASLALALCLAAPKAATAEDAAPMPQTRGMQGMDPALHDQWAQQGQSDPYKDCIHNPAKAAQQAEHPMPQTRGMQGMDPKAHEYDCSQRAAAKPATGKHVHRTGVN